MIALAFAALLAAILTPLGWAFFGGLAALIMTVPLICEGLATRRIA